MSGQNNYLVANGGYVLHVHMPSCAQNPERKLKQQHHMVTHALTAMFNSQSPRNNE